VRGSALQLNFGFDLFDLSSTLIELGDSLLNLILDLVKHCRLLAVESRVLQSERLDLSLVFLVLLLRLVKLLLQILDLSFLTLDEFGHLVIVAGSIETLLVNLGKGVAFKVALAIKVVATTYIFDFNLF
jgi:hypothetical protein